MNKSPVDLASAYRLLNPGPVVIVSVAAGERDNLFTVTWNMPAAKDPPAVVLLSGRGHFSLPFIERTGEFAINVPDVSLADAVYGCGTTSGRAVTDKFGRFGLTRQPAMKIGAPLVAEAVANLECRVEVIHDVLGSALIVARVVAAQACNEHVIDGQWSFDHGLQLLHHLSGRRFCSSGAEHVVR
jgi:flavin reductase (DIM6/NTAB) family NADH-FMN oxidoreductase RutF